MAKKKKEEIIEYQIHDIRELEIHVPLLSEEVAVNFDKKKLDYGFTIDYHWDLKKELFSVVIEINYAYDRKGLNENLLNYTGELEYQIRNLKKFIDTENNETKLPEQFLAILTGIAISTVRGMIATRTFGKFQGDFYIPILNPGEVVKAYLASESNLLEEAK